MSSETFSLLFSALLLGWGAEYFLCNALFILLFFLLVLLLYTCAVDEYFCMEKKYVHLFEGYYFLKNIYK